MLNKILQKYGPELVNAGLRLYQRGLLAAADGNISVRVENLVIITPSGKAKGFLSWDQMAIMDCNGEVLLGQPSGEKWMHLKIYQCCPEARAVVHAHPPYAVGFSLAHPRARELPADALSELTLAAGRIPVVPYARATSLDMAEALTPFLPDSRLLILARHGGLAWGEEMEEAVGGMERLDHCAQMLFIAQAFGGPKMLPLEELAELRAMRAKIGAKLF